MYYIIRVYQQGRKLYQVWREVPKPCFSSATSSGHLAGQISEENFCPGCWIWEQEKATMRCDGFVTSKSEDLVRFRSSRAGAILLQGMYQSWDKVNAFLDSISVQWIPDDMVGSPFQGLRRSIAIWRLRFGKGFKVKHLDSVLGALRLVQAKYEV